MKERHGLANTQPQPIKEVPMKYISVLNRFAMVVASVVILSQQTAFAGTDLSRSKAEELLQKVTADWLSQQCSLAPSKLLGGKPEFASLKGQSYCRMKITVTGIRTTSPTEAIVEWAAAGEVNQAFIKQWLEAMNKLKDRLTHLPPEKYSNMPFTIGGSCARYGHKFRDPSDGYIFVSQDVTDIKQVSEWEQFETWQKQMSDLLAKGKIQTSTYNALFQLWDDGWRVMKSS